MRRAFVFSLLRRSFSTIKTTTSPPSSSSSSILTTNELEEINSLILRLCSSDNFRESIRLLSVSLLASVHPLSLTSLPLLVDRIAATAKDSSDLSSSMYLLTTLRHHNRPHLLSCSSLLLSSFIRHNRLHGAAEILTWLLRDDSPCRPDREIYRVFVGGLWEKNGRAVEVVKAVREMVRDGLEVGDEVRGWVWDCMLREARVVDANKLDLALRCSDGGSVAEAGESMDGMISEWQD